jgi:hypothetical protein
LLDIIEHPWFYKYVKELVADASYHEHWKTQWSDYFKWCKYAGGQRFQNGPALRRPNEDNASVDELLDRVLAFREIGEGRDDTIENSSDADEDESEDGYDAEDEDDENDEDEYESYDQDDEQDEDGDGAEYSEEDVDTAVKQGDYTLGPAECSDEEKLPAGDNIDSLGTIWNTDSQAQDTEEDDTKRAKRLKAWKVEAFNLGCHRSWSCYVAA